MSKKPNTTKKHTLAALGELIRSGDLDVSDVMRAIYASQPDQERVAKIVELALDVCGDAEVDEGAALVSEGPDNGAYVSAWVWVPFDGTPLDKEPDSD